MRSTRTTAARKPVGRQPTARMEQKPDVPAARIDQRAADRIRTRRIEIGMTQEHFAAAIGVTYQQAHKYEKGINRVSIGRLYLICRALGMSADAIVFAGEDGRQEDPPSLPLSARNAQRLMAAASAVGPALTLSAARFLEDVATGGDQEGMH